MVFGIIPECRSASLRNERSASPESPKTFADLHPIDKPASNSCSMDAVSSDAKAKKPLPSPDTLDTEPLKSLVLAQRSALDSGATEIKNLNLLILKLKRIHSRPHSEKFNHDIEQLKLRLVDLEANWAAAEPLPEEPTTIALTEERSKRRTVCYPRTAPRNGGDRTRRAVLPDYARALHSLAGPKLLERVLVSKYANHLPL